MQDSVLSKKEIGTSDMEKNNWLSHVEWVVMFVTLIVGFYRLESKIQNCSNRMDQFFIACHEESKNFQGK
jgi:hypothetical protein